MQLLTALVLLCLQVVLHSPDSIAAVGVLHPTAFHVQPKRLAAHGSSSSGETMPSAAATAGAGCGSVTQVPDDWQPRLHTSSSVQPSSTPAPLSSGVEHWCTRFHTTTSQQHVHIMCSAHLTDAARQHTPQCTTADSPRHSFTSDDTACALDAALLAITAQLARSCGATCWECSCFVHLYLADMSHFAAANAAYCRHLPQINPPSRACVQVSVFARQHHWCPVPLSVTASDLYSL